MKVYPTTYAVFLRGRMVAVVSYLQGRLLTVLVTTHGAGDIAETMVLLPSHEKNINHIDGLRLIPAEEITLTQ